MATSLLVSYRMTSWSRKSSGNAPSVSPQDPTGEAKERSQYTKMKEYTGDKIQLRVQKSACSLKDDNGVVEVTEFERSTEMV